MSGRPKFSDAALVRVLGTRKPASLDDAGRVRLLDEAFSALLDGKLPSREAALFVGGGGKKWLQSGGDLARDHFKVVRPKSRRTASAIWREMQAHPDDDQEPEEQR